jgi:hypothetical protein
MDRAKNSFNFIYDFCTRILILYGVSARSVIEATRAGLSFLFIFYLISMHKQVIFLRWKCGVRNRAVEMRSSRVGVSERKGSKEAAGVRCGEGMKPFLLLLCAA